ncbi:MAG: DUF4325 domain-containing protein [Deltaproteobacteria bacterium]|nr:DUF4325 domain-containing protein [Deltaproteobacteria bacterium]
MSMIQMNKFGKTLTDREDGKKVFNTIILSNQKPYILNFEGVISLGSSFGDEVVIKLAQLQDNKIQLININDGIRSCIKRVIEGTSVKVEFEK